MSASPEQRLIDTFVELADTLVDDYDVLELLGMLVDRSCEILGATGGGILLAAPDGRLGAVAASGERSQLFSLLQLAAGEGPSVDAYTSAAAVDVRGYSAIYARWPTFAVAASEHGYAAVHAVPLRLRQEILGTLNLFFDAPAGLGDGGGRIARGLADIATIGILQERAVRESGLAQQQLQHALDSRVLIEQAKGIIAQTEGIGMDEAFERLRKRARSTRKRISEAAREVIGAAADASGSEHAAT